MTDEELKDLVLENNQILKKMRRAQRRGRIFSVLYWFFVIGVALGFFYYLGPLIAKLTDILQDILNTATGAAGSLGDANIFNGLFGQISGKN
jgi:hypothetical protein